MSNNSHSYIYDKRNDDIIIFINGIYHKRKDAKISVFDSGFLLGDGVWESFRLHNGHLCFIENHLDRLYAGAKSLKINISYNRDKMISIINDTITKNNMNTNVHIRLIVSRGLKSTPYQHPDATVGEPTIVIIPEYKLADKNINLKGISLSSVKTVRGTHLNQDPRINSLSKFNCIAACIESYNNNTDEGLMLDINGHVATCNSTNFFTVKDNKVFTSKGDYCINGITRYNIIELCKDNNIPVFEEDFDLKFVYNSDESFVTGTFSGVIPVTSIDGKLLSNGLRGPITKGLYTLYKKHIERLYPIE